MSISVNTKKSLFLAFALFWMSSVGRADGGVSFTQAAPDPGGNPDAQTGLIAQLKLKAVTEYLQNYLGPRFASVEKTVNYDFSERYVLDYKVGRTADRSQIQVVGHLDSDGLKRWVRTLDAKTKGSNALSPFLILTSTLPNLPYSVGDTAARVKDSVFAQTLLADINSGLQKYNMKVAATDLSRVGLKTPPMNDNDIKTLRDQSGGNSALWVTVAPCKGCTGIRLDMYFYNLTQGRRLLAHSDDITISMNDLSDKAKLKTALKLPIDQFHSEFDEVVTSGTLTSASYDITVEQVNSYKTFKMIESSLGKLDFIVQAVLNRTEPTVAGFQVLSPLSAQELAQRLAAENFAGFHLKPVRVDSKSLVVRYSE